MSMPNTRAMKLFINRAFDFSRFRETPFMTSRYANRYRYQSCLAALIPQDFNEADLIFARTVD